MVPTVEFASPQSINSSTFESADDTELTHRFCIMRNVLHISPVAESDKELHFLAAEEPCSFGEAEQHAIW